MYKEESGLFGGTEDQTDVESKSQLSDSETGRFQAPEKKLKTIPWREFDVPPPIKAMPIDRPNPQPQKPINTMNPDILRQLRSELEANPEAQSLPEIDAQIMKHLQAQLNKDSDELETKDQTKGGKKLWQDLLDREKNFHDGGKWALPEDDPFLAEFEGLYRGLEADFPKLGNASRLRLIYSRTYDFLTTFDSVFAIFGRKTPLYEEVFDVCMFMGLCMFLHNTTKIEGTTLSQYTYAHCHLGFNDKTSTSYIEHEGVWKQGERTEALDSHENTMRQFRHRLFKSRIVDNRRSEWHGMPASSEYEWKLYFDYVDADGCADSQQRETLKRIKNLYNDVNKAIRSNKDDGFGERMDDAWRKFKSKLHKIKYENYLDLCKVFLEHIEKEQEDAGKNWKGSTCYGINLYRFEKELCLFEFVNYTKRLLMCDNKQEEMEVLGEATALQNICFPRIRDKFYQGRPLEEVHLLVQKFFHFQYCFICLSRLLIDKLVENGYLGEDWETLFLSEINERSVQILYSPKSIDYSVGPDLQEAFEKLLMFQTRWHLNAHLTIWKHGSQQKNAEND